MAELARILHHDAILIELCVDDRDLPLTKGVVESIVDRLDGYIQAGCGHAVDRDVQLKPQVLLVAGDISQA